MDIFISIYQPPVSIGLKASRKVVHEVCGPWVEIILSHTLFSKEYRKLSWSELNGTDVFQNSISKRR